MSNYTRNKKIKHTHNKKVKYTRNKKVKHTKNKTIKNYVGGIGGMPVIIYKILTNMGLSFVSLILLPIYYTDYLVSLLRLPLKTLVKDITGGTECEKIFSNNDSCDKTLLCYLSNNKNCKWKDHAYINVEREGEGEGEKINSRFNYLGMRDTNKLKKEIIKLYIGDFIKKLIIIFKEEKQEKKQKYIINYFTKNNVITQIKLLQILLYNNDNDNGIKYKLLKYPNKIPYPWKTPLNDKPFFYGKHFSYLHTGEDTTDGVPMPLLYDTFDNIRVLLKRMFISYTSEIKSAINSYEIPENPTNIQYIKDKTIKNIIDTLYQIIEEKKNKKGEVKWDKDFDNIKHVYFKINS